MDDRSRSVIAGTAVAGPMVAGIFALATWDGVSSPGALVVLGAVALLTSLTPIRVARSGGTFGFTVEGGAFIAMLLTGHAPLAPALLVAVSAVGHAMRTRDVAKVSFNTGRSGLETTSAALLYLLLVPTGAGPVHVGAVAAALAAGIVFELVSILVLTELFHRRSGAPRSQAARDVGQMSLIVLVGNVGYGVILATVVLVSLPVGVLTGLLMPVVYLGYRGYAKALVGQRRATGLNEMTHVLIDVVRSDDGLGQIVSRLAEVFGAGEGLLVVADADGYVQWRSSDDGIEVDAHDHLPRAGLLAEAMARGETILRVNDNAPGAVAAPIRRGGVAIGAVAVRERRGVERWEEADASLLAVIANELSVALDNVELFRQVEEERARLEAESTKLNDILTAATDGIVSVLVDGSIEAWNPGMSRITGVDARAAIGQPWHAVLRLKDGAGSELAPTGDHVMSQAMAGHHAGESLTLQALRADGVWRWLQCTSSPVRNPDGTTRGVVLVARDVTGERELEELKSDFIATVSHELRTPLTPLKGFLATLRNPRTALSEDQLGAIHGAMGTQLLRLETLISDLLAVAEIDHGQFDLRPEPLEISDLVADAVEVEAADELSRCSVLVEPDVIAVADSVALVRIVRSLVSNALKHTAADVEVVVRSLSDHVEVVVRDEGPGIAQWDQDRIFNRFERLGNHLNRTQGPGLGLTIARSLARRMGGDVELTSDIGRGATFTLTMPRAKPRPVSLRAASEA